jgi:aldehyde dehydrogenase (NAD+)
MIDKIMNYKKRTKELDTKKSDDLKEPIKKTKGFRFEYSESLESTKIVNIKKNNLLFINGKFVSPKVEKSFATINPATGEVLGKISEAGKEDVDQAVMAARNAFQKYWSKTSGTERSQYLFRIARLIQERSRELAVLETLDNGKPIKESRDVDIPLVAAHFFYYAGWADKLAYAFPNQSIKPLGVAAQIVPWNFPLLMAAWKIAPALATGNCVVLKPAETTSLSTLLLAEIIQQSGLPEGVVNIITGAGNTGSLLVNHPDVNKVAFTGSTEVGKLIAKDLSHTNKKLTLELGGKSAHIIYEDAAIDQAVEGIVNGIFFNQGHVCCAGSRLLVEESVSHIVVEKLKSRMEKIRIGNPLDKNTDVGAINSSQELEKIKSMIEDGKNEGWEFYSASATEPPSKGYYQKPCFFNNVASSATIFRKEIFGPVLTISTFRTPNEAISKANDTPYGLAAGVWSEKASKIQKTALGLKAGVVWANTYNKFDPASPFGGYQESGWGREGGRHGLIPYVEVQ